MAGDGGRGRRWSADRVSGQGGGMVVHGVLLEAGSDAFSRHSADEEEDYLGALYASVDAGEAVGAFL